IVCGLLILFAWLYPYIVIQTLYNNSSIVLDISQSLRFDGLRIVALLTVLISGVSAFLFSHPFISILASHKTGKYQPLIAFFLAVVAFTIINEISGQAYVSSLICGTVSCLIVYGLRLFKNLKVLSYGTFAYLFI